MKHYNPMYVTGDSKNLLQITRRRLLWLTLIIVLFVVAGILLANSHVADRTGTLINTQTERQRLIEVTPQPTSFLYDARLPQLV